MSDPRRVPTGWIPAAAGGTGVLGLLWLGGLALAGTGLPVWAFLAAGTIGATTLAIGYALTQLSHGGSWGWTPTRRRPHQADSRRKVPTP